MFENLKLYHKGLLLVSVPLAFELLFIGLLAVALQQADRAIQAEAHARTVSDQLAMMQRHHFEAVSALGSYGVSRNPTFLSGFEVGIELIKSDLANLKRLTSLNTQQSEEFVKVEKIVQVELARSSEIKSMLANRQSVELIASFKSLKKIMGALSAHLDAIGEQEKRSLQTGPVVRSQMRQHIWMLLLAGLVLNVILAIALARYFGVTTVRRLSVLMNHTVKLGKGETIDSSPGGSDEIGELGQRFDTMAAELRASQRLRREFVAMVTHELKSPLTSVSGVLEVLGEDKYGAISDRGKQKLTVAHRNIEKMLGLIRDLIDIERLESKQFDLELVEINPNPLVHRTLELISPLAESRGITLASALPTDVEIVCDEERIVQVLTNLISNAIKFSPDDSRIEVRGCVSADNPSMFEIKVIDHGRGIPVEHVERIFDRFAQVELADAKSKGGSGLGLAVCKGLIEQHGGAIGVNSVEGSGSTFWFTLPLANMDVESATPSESTSECRPAKMDR